MNTRETINIDIKNTVSHSTEYTTHELILSQYFVELLENLFVVENSNIFYFKHLDMECMGYIEAESKFILFNSIFSNEKNCEISFTPINNLKNFYKNLNNTLIQSLDEGNENIDDLLYIKNKIENKNINIELAIFTNNIVGDKNKYEITIYDLDDLVENLDTSFNVSNIILSNYLANDNTTFRYVENTVNDVETYLLFLPASILAKFYEEFHEKLLSNNIRYYLSKNNSINSGILKTLLEEPENFVSYNNGISAVCNDIKTVDNNIVSIDGLQIVNGGQTTATIYEAYKMEADLSKVFVQFKISVIKNIINKHEKITSIARYANSQNKIQMSDLSSNEKFFSEVELFSRKTSIPKNQFIHGDKRWYFERVRGQYEIDKTNNIKINFSDLYPKNLKINKEELAKYIMSWEHFPNDVSLGAQKNFNSFIKLLKISNAKLNVDLDYYKKIITIAILFKTVDQIVKELKLGYKNIIVTYTVALFSLHNNKQIDVNEIWEAQSLSIELTSILKTYALNISKQIEITVSTLKDPNVTTWAKKPTCWEDIKIIKNIPYNISHPELVNFIYIPKVDITNLSINQWWSMASWGKNTNSLNPSERQMAATIAKYLQAKENGSTKELSKKQLMFAEKVYNSAFDKGFKEFLDIV